MSGGGEGPWPAELPSDPPGTGLGWGSSSFGAFWHLSPSHPSRLGLPKKREMRLMGGRVLHAQKTPRP